MLLFYLSMIDTPEEQEKFERIYLSYRKLMIKVAMDILHDSYLAEDAVSQAFVQLIPNLGKIGDVASHQTKNYLIIIVRRVCFAFYNERKKIIQVSYENLGDDDLLASEDDNILEQMLFPEVLEKIGTLPDIYADALYLMYCEDYSIKKIADITGISVSAVKKRLERARQQLKAVLAGEEVVST